MNSARGEFAVGEQPLVSSSVSDEPKSAENFDDLGELPRAYDVPLLVTVAHDPRTLFAYWDIDWRAAFRDTPPRDRTVYLRVLANGATVESMLPVEPLAGSSYVRVANADTDYRIELGYYDKSGEWNSVILSDRVLTPRDRMEQSAEFQLVTVPLHLSFQRLVETFRGSKFDGQAIGDAIAQLQQRFENDASPDAITAEHAQLVEALEWSLSPGEADERAAFRSAAKEKPIGRARLERILGFGATSPASSWSSDFAGGS